MLFPISLVTVIPRDTLALSDCFNIVFTGVFSLLGVVVGAALAQNHAKKVERRKELIDCYAQFFSTYTEFVAQQTTENKGRVICALEVAKLLCPAQTAELFKQFENSMLHDEPIASRANLVEKIRVQGQQDLLTHQKHRKKSSAQDC